MTEENRNYDFVFCVDGTGSMAPYMDKIRAFIREMPNMTTEMFDENDYPGKCTVRIKIIVFRDYRDDAAPPMEESPFFEIPKESEALERALQKIEAGGGGDEPENGWEALYLAMKSDFRGGRSIDRQCIVLISDDDAIPIKECEGAPGYPEDMVDIVGLCKFWHCGIGGYKLRERSKALFIFAPERTSYEGMSCAFNRSAFFPLSFDGDNICGLDAREMLKILIGGYFPEYY